MVSNSTNKFGFFSFPLLVILFLSAAAVIGSILVEALIPPVGQLCVQQHPYQVSTRLSLQKGWIDNNDDDENINNYNNNGKDDDDDDDDDRLVTREDVNRDILGLEPIVKRKRKNGKQGGGGGYRPLDNRDHLPFSVRTNTPEDPYKTKFLKERQKQEQNKINNEITNNKQKKTTTDLEHHLLPSTNRISPEANNKNKKNNKKQSDTTTSRLIQKRSNKDNNNDKMSETVIGEYQLDKSTTSGDVIVIGEKEYQVQQARCQYKYAGGQRFVMVRKILEVKEINRVQTEEALMRQYKKSSSSTLPEGSLD
jgi:hypothetical protein